MSVDVTILVVARERFSFARQSLESIYGHSKTPFHLVYVDGGSPRAVKGYLEAQSKAKGFTLIRREEYLRPNQARNLGLRDVRTKYVVIIDNDILVSPGWLEPLVKCADDTGAALVSPLYLQGIDADPVIHMAGGRHEIAGGAVINEMGHIGRRLSSVTLPAAREPSKAIEFHCVLARTEWVTGKGALDEDLLTTRDHVDLSLRVQAAGGTIFFEPRSSVRWVPTKRLAWSDLGFFFFRWSDTATVATIGHFERKWNVMLKPAIRTQVRSRRRRAIGGLFLPGSWV